MTAPDGSQWHGDGGNYRLGKGVRICADALERSVVHEVCEAMKSDEMATGIAAHYRRLRAAAKTPAETAAMKKRIAEIDRKTARLADLISETSAPDALLRQIEALEEEREKIAASIEGIEADKAAARALREITAADVKQFLHKVAENMNAASPEELRDALRETVEKVILTPDTFSAEIYFRLAPASKSGERVASPRGFEPRLSP